MNDGPTNRSSARELEFVQLRRWTALSVARQCSVRGQTDPGPVCFGGVLSLEISQRLAVAIVLALALASGGERPA